MKDKETDGHLPSDGQWFLYILRCRSDTFYTGITKDIGRRLKMHNDGKASRYTRARRPVRLIYYEHCASRAQALVRECAVKALTKGGKEKLVSSCSDLMSILEKGNKHG